MVSVTYMTTPSKRIDEFDTDGSLDGDEYIIVQDPTSKAYNKATISQITSAGGAVDSVNGATGTVVLDADDIDDTSTTHKFVTATDITKLSNTSGTNTGDQDLSTYQLKPSEGAFANGDKTKLDGIETGATADQTGAEIKATYEAELDTNAYTDAEKTKLAGIETAADVTDTTNVTAAGALMDSEVTNLAQVKAFSSTDYATSAQGALADSALQNVVEDTTPQLGGELDAQTNNITNLGDITFKTGAVGGTVRTGTSAADKFELQAYDVDGGAYQKVLEVDAGNDPTLEVFTSTFRIWDSVDESKQLQVDLGSVATGTTRTITMANADVDLADIATNNAKISFDATSSSKLAGIEAGADVTDATNVAAAGAVMDTGNETIAGIKTFSSFPVTPSAAPTTDYQTANKKYVDDELVAAGSYNDESAQDAVGTILTDSSEIDFTYNDVTPSITASIVAGSIDETKLDTSVNASLDLADSATQPGDLVINVKDYGATGDGTTDDTTAIQNAINAAETANGGIVYLPGGKNYYITSTLTITKAVQMRGVAPTRTTGVGTTITYATGTGNAIHFNGADGATIEGIRLAGSSVTGGNAILIDNAAYNISVKRVRIVSGYSGILINGANTINIMETDINTLTGDYGIRFTGPDAAGKSDLLRLFKVIINPGSTNTTTDCLVHDSYADTVQITSCVFLYGKRGVLMKDVANTGTSYPNFIFATDLEVERSDERCVYLFAGRTFQAYNSYFSVGNGPGIDVASSFGGLVNINGCYIRGNAQHGILFNSVGLLVNSSFIGNNSTDGSGTYHAISLGSSADKVTINSNHLGTLVGGTNNQGYGVFSSTSNEVHVLNNNYTGSVTGGYNKFSTTDANGWTIYDYGTWKVYTQRFTGSTSSLASLSLVSIASATWPVALSPVNAKTISVEPSMSGNQGRYVFTATNTTGAANSAFQLHVRNVTSATISDSVGVVVTMYA